MGMWTPVSRGGSTMANRSYVLEEEAPKRTRKPTSPVVPHVPPTWEPLMACVRALRLREAEARAQDAERPPVEDYDHLFESEEVPLAADSMRGLTAELPPYAAEVLSRNRAEEG